MNSRHRRISLITQVTEQLRAHIHAGDWPIGSRIPTEPELVNLLGVGRNTIREAVQALMHVGLLERRQGSGTYVTGHSELAGVIANRLVAAAAGAVAEPETDAEAGTPAGAAPGAGPLATAEPPAGAAPGAGPLARARRRPQATGFLAGGRASARPSTTPGAQPGPGSPRTVAEAMEVRRAFEVEAARLAAHRRTTADLTVLDAALARLAAAWEAGDVAAYVDADATLHLAVVRAAHNSLLSGLYEDFGAALRQAIAANVGSELDPARRIDHAPLVEAIRRGDSDAAAMAAAVPLDPEAPAPPA